MVLPRMAVLLSRLCCYDILVLGILELMSSSIANRASSIAPADDTSECELLVRSVQVELSSSRPEPQSAEASACRFD